MFENSTDNPREMSAMAKVFYPRAASANGGRPKGGVHVVPDIAALHSG